jgi:hypothetical protein
MDRAEAARLLRRELADRAQRSHAALAELVDDVLAYEVEGAGEVRYQVELEAHWVARPGGPIQVLAGIDDGTLRGAFRPVTDRFLKDPDGSVTMAQDEGG